jgi:mono/diheme cytochrome c family protein
MTSDVLMSFRGQLEPWRALAEPRIATSDAPGKRTHIVTLAAAIVAAAVNANAQDVAAGHALAREACNACHIVEPDKRLPRKTAIGPAFREIANASGMTATALQAFLQTSHPKMPNLILTPGERADVIAYILSLRDQR